MRVKAILVMILDVQHETNMLLSKMSNTIARLEEKISNLEKAGGKS
jgi:hypothetical protein